ncbi:hypothetical protein A2U01_0111740, partial [Trifolium medium]|nr:hypothetical protein [Trifolium medium]
WRVAPASAEEIGELLSSARRVGEDGASRQSVRILPSGTFVQWRVAQLHLARRVPSLFITRAAQN